MSKRNDIHTILIVGAGPIVIGQAAEFDYSGTQAVKALKAEGYRVVLVNSNPATIMTDPDLADATYVEPITPEILELIIEQERPDALLPTVGGQTALNMAIDLAERGVLDRHGVTLIGASLRAMQLAEDRRLFRDTMIAAGLEVPQGGMAGSLDEARAVAADIGRFPLLIRPSYTLGGSGGGVVFNRSEFEDKVAFGLSESPAGTVLIEESVLGWKEYELEVMRDGAGNYVVVCSIENFDPMGVHTGISPRPGYDAHGSRIPAAARPGARRDGCRRRADGRIERAVRGQSRRWARAGDRNESTRQPLVGAGQQGHRLPDCEAGRAAGGRLYAGRTAQ
jgi:carbamoyl-phosphate synthase large subunit